MSVRINWAADGTFFYWGETDESRFTPSQTVKNILDADDSSASTVDLDSQGILYRGRWFIWNFKQPVTIDKVKYRNTATDGFSAQTLTAQYSTNTTNGIDGTWYNIGSDGNFRSVNITQTLNVTPTSTQWFRLELSGQTNSYYMYRHYTAALHLFGSYDSSNLELHDTLDTVITDDTFLNFSVANSGLPYLESKVFKIKNNTAETHKYDVSVVTSTYAADSLISGQFTVDDGVTSGAATLQTADVLPGAYSANITVHADIPTVNNPANGLHFPKVVVSEV